MALENGNGNGMVMPVQPLYGNGGGYGYPVAMPMYANGGFGDNLGGDWLALFLIAALFGGFGGGWGMGGFGMGGFGGMFEFPWLLAGQQGINTNTNEGFQNALLNDNITSARDAISALSTQLCGCCGDMQMQMANGFAGVEQGANARQIANMQQQFANQTAMLQGFNDVGLQLCQASADNRLGVASLGSDIAREACATRTTDTQNTQAILTAISDGFKAMSDQRYQDKIDAKNDEIAQLRQENLYARGQASQIAQNSTIIDGIYNRLNQCPIGTVPVYGEQPIFTCPNNNNYGCGCGNF